MIHIQNFWRYLTENLQPKWGTIGIIIAKNLAKMKKDTNALWSRMAQFSDQEVLSEPPTVYSSKDLVKAFGDATKYMVSAQTVCGLSRKRNRRKSCQKANQFQASKSTIGVPSTSANTRNEIHNGRTVPRMQRKRLWVASRPILQALTQRSCKSWKVNRVEFGWEICTWTPSTIHGSLSCLVRWN